MKSRVMENARAYILHKFLVRPSITVTKGLAFPVAASSLEDMTYTLLEATVLV